jgi:anti-sigma factor RsiW
VGQGDCAHLLDELDDFLDEQASADLCAEIERHMAQCGDCRVVVDTLRRTIRLYRALPQPGFPAEARERLYRSLELGRFLTPSE